MAGGYIWIVPKIALKISMGRNVTAHIVLMVYIKLIEIYYIRCNLDVFDLLIT